jgi:hypothetical protein
MRPDAEVGCQLVALPIRDHAAASRPFAPIVRCPVADVLEADMVLNCRLLSNPCVEDIDGN